MWKWNGIMSTTQKANNDRDIEMGCRIQDLVEANNVAGEELDPLRWHNVKINHISLTCFISRLVHNTHISHTSLCMIKYRGLHMQEGCENMVCNQYRHVTKHVCNISLCAISQMLCTYKNVCENVMKTILGEKDIITDGILKQQEWAKNYS